jgi:hypothetical protein
MIHQVNRSGLKAQIKHLSPGESVVVHGRKHVIRSVGEPLPMLMAVSPDRSFGFEDGGSCLERDIDTVIFASGEAYTVYAYGESPL